MNKMRDFNNYCKEHETCLKIPDLNARERELRIEWLKHY
jgi:hypothetical protein